MALGDGDVASVVSKGPPDSQKLLEEEESVTTDVSMLGDPKSGAAVLVSTTPPGVILAMTRCADDVNVLVPGGAL
jgi:hypothetical protein